jgi:bacteriorhodopsin
MNLLISALITFLIVILVLYLVNMLPIDGRAKQIVRIVVIIIGILSLLRYLAVFSERGIRSVACCVSKAT